VKVKIEAIEESYFSFAILTDPDSSKQGPNLKYGIPEYITLKTNQ
jgi:hypothetical protein